jgi:protein SCO1/2
MLRRCCAGLAPVALVSLTAVLAAVFGSARVAADNARWGANYFPNVTLTTQDGAKVHFYDDLIKGKIVVIDLIYTTCKYACPLETARLVQVQQMLGDRMGKDVFFYSITIDPEHDTPAVLKDYAAKYHTGPGWLFLTGKQDDIDQISKKLGLYSEPDPTNKDGHQPFVLIGNEATGQWMRNGALDNPRFLARTIGDWMSSWRNGQTLKPNAPSDGSALQTKFDVGKYEFTSHCLPCHTIGEGVKVGPDLLGVAAARERVWLTKLIIAPDKLLADGDPVMRDLFAKYKVSMPSLGLSGTDAAVIIDYIERQTASVRSAGTK